VEVLLHTFLTPALDGDEWSASHPGHFTPEGKKPHVHWIGGWVDPRASLDLAAKTKISIIVLARNQTPVAQPVA